MRYLTLKEFLDSRLDCIDGSIIYAMPLDIVYPYYQCEIIVKDPNVSKLDDLYNEQNKIFCFSVPIWAFKNDSDSSPLSNQFYFILKAGNERGYFKLCDEEHPGMDLHKVSVPVLNGDSIICEDEEALTEDNKDSFAYQIHASGEASVTSINKRDDPLVFINYGFPESDLKTSLSVASSPMLHIDYKHKTIFVITDMRLENYAYYMKNRTSLSCDWYFPVQPITYGFKNLFLAIQKNNGRVFFIREKTTISIVDPNGEIEKSVIVYPSLPNSRSNPQRPGRTYTETGLTVLIHSSDSHDIYVMGDNEFDYSEMPELNPGSYILIPNRGSKYTWRFGKNMFNDIPLVKDAKLIVSYGIENIFKNPSMIEDYLKAGYQNVLYAVGKDLILKI
jgi:hypothetical protein